MDDDEVDLVSRREGGSEVDSVEGTERRAELTGEGSGLGAEAECLHRRRRPVQDRRQRLDHLRVQLSPGGVAQLVDRAATA